MLDIDTKMQSNFKVNVNHKPQTNEQKEEPTSDSTNNIQFSPIYVEPEVHEDFKIRPRHRNKRNREKRMKYNQGPWETGKDFSDGDESLSKFPDTFTNDIGPLKLNATFISSKGYIKNYSFGDD